MGIFYDGDEDETEADEEYEVWFSRILREIEDFDKHSRKSRLVVGASKFKLDVIDPRNRAE